jgi:transcriptional regulator with XRE-family HTH domain
MPRKANKRSPSTTDTDIGQRIRARRLEQGLSQTELAVKIGLTFQQVQKYEKGTNRVGGGRLSQIAEVLEVKPSYFFASEDVSNGGTDRTEIFQLLSEGKAKAGIRILRALSKIEDQPVVYAIAELCEGIANQYES